MNSRPNRPDGNGKGFTLLEFLLTAVILTVMVAMVLGMGTNAQRESRLQETRQIHTVLARALSAYHDETGAFPPGRGDADSGAALLRALRSVPASADALKWLPVVAVATDERGQATLVDGFADRVRYDDKGGLGGTCPLLRSRGGDAADPSDDLATDIPRPRKADGPS